MNPAIRVAYDRVCRAERLLVDAISNTYSPGDVVTYEHGYHAVNAKVVKTLGEHLLVESLNSGKQYKIYATRCIS